MYTGHVASVGLSENSRCWQAMWTSLESSFLISYFDLQMPDNKKQESVLVVVLAETRAYEHTFELFKSNMLDIFDADLCLCVAENDREEKNNPFYQHAKYVWTYEEPDDWGDAFDYAQKSKGYENNWRKILEIKDQWLGGIKGDESHPGSAGILLFFRWFLRESIIAHNVLQKYDRFVVTRSDFVHRVPHVPLNLLDPDKIWIPYGESYGGYTDRHIIAHKNDIPKILSIADDIIANPDKLHSQMKHSSKWNLEKYIKWSFSRLDLESRVRKFPYTMYSVRSVNGHTRWAAGHYDEELGYCIKYNKEFESYRFASALIENEADWNKFKMRILMIVKFIMDSNKMSRIIYKLRLITVAKKFIGLSKKLIPTTH